MQQKQVLIAGANGMIGGIILKNCLKRNDVGKVTVIVRRSLGISHPKLIEVLHLDFLDYSSVETHFENQDVCFFCIGVYTGQVPTTEFIRITVDVTKQFAETLKRKSPQATFCFLSGQGADSRETSKVLFAREKGKAENILKKLGFGALHIFRPGYIYPVTPRKEPNSAYRIMRFIYKYFLAYLSPSVGITSEKLAGVMTEVGLNGGSQIIYENTDLRKYSLETGAIRS